MKKGFTLIELVGTIVILSLALLIVVPVVTNNVKKGMQNADKDTKASIELAAKNWAIDNMGTVGTGYCVTVINLQNNGYLDKNLKMPSTKADINTAGVQITQKIINNEKTYTYEYKDQC